MPMCLPRPYQSSQQSAATANSIKCHAFVHGVANDIFEKYDNTIALPWSRGPVNFRKAIIIELMPHLPWPTPQQYVILRRLACNSTQPAIAKYTNCKAGKRTRVTSMATMYPTTRPLMPMSSRINAPAIFDQLNHCINFLCPCHWRPLILVPVGPNGSTTPISKSQRGGIEPLHVSMPREVKSRPSTSSTHSGITAKILTKMIVCVSQFPILCEPMPRPPA
jgi:hypothetical protein